MLEGAGGSGIPFTASPDGAIRRGTIDAKDERRRSDVQNMKAVCSKVRVKYQCVERSCFAEKMHVCNFELG
jgi:hypothetical protein